MDVQCYSVQCCAVSFGIFFVSFWVMDDHDKVRFCRGEGCTKRMAAIKNDGHTLCSSCRGKFCSFADRCTECRDWSDEFFNKFLKLRFKRERDRMGKLEKRRSKSTPHSEPHGISSPP